MTPKRSDSGTASPPPQPPAPRVGFAYVPRKTVADDYLRRMFKASEFCRPMQRSSRPRRTAKSTSMAFVFAPRLRADQKVVHLLARSKLRRQPAGLFTATRPSLSRIFRIPVFGKDLWVRTALAVRGDNVAGRSNLVQPLLKLGLLDCQFTSQFRGYLFMKLPQVIDGHRLQIAVFHWTPPSVKRVATTVATTALI